MKKNFLLGAHLSVAGGFDRAIERAEEIGANVVQIFTKSNRSWYARPIEKRDTDLFLAALRNSSVEMVVAHASYLINLASASPVTANKSLSALREELVRCDLLNIPYLVIHPGSHGGFGLESGIAAIADGINAAYRSTGAKVTLLIENMAGQGSVIGSTFDELSRIIDLVKDSSKVGVCLDTCHLYAAGYDISTSQGLAKTLAEFDSVVGKDQIKLVHLNDSKKELNSRVDRHANIDQGLIGLSGIENLVTHEFLSKLPFVLETPAESHQDYASEIKIIKNLF